MRIAPVLVFGPVVPFLYCTIACDPDPPRIRSAHEELYAGSANASATTRARVFAPDAGPLPGEEYCRELATKGTSLGNANFAVGVLAGVGSLAVLTLGTTVASNNSSSTNAWDQNRGTVLNVTSLPLAVMAYYYLSRANAAYETAAQANDARNQLRDTEMWRVCNTTWSAWDRSHASSDAIIRAALNEKLAIQSDAGDDFAGLNSPPPPAIPPDGGH